MSTISQSDKTAQKTFLTVRVTPEFHKALRMKAVEGNTSLQALVYGVLDRYLNRGRQEKNHAAA